MAQNLLQEGLLPGIELQDLYSIQDLIHQSDAAVHELHLNLLSTRQRGFYVLLLKKKNSHNYQTKANTCTFVNMGLSALVTAVVVFLNIMELV